MSSVADAHLASRELDEAVHRCVFGLDPEKTFVNSYSDDSACGWASVQAVVEQMIWRGWRVGMSHDGVMWLVTFQSTQYPFSVRGASANGLPEAISRAALKVFT